jgi:hypothetical protein
MAVEQERAAVEKAVRSCARMVRELGPSMSPGSLAAAIERNIDVIVEKSCLTNQQEPK